MQYNKHWVKFTCIHTHTHSLSLSTAVNKVKKIHIANEREEKCSFDSFESRWRDAGDVPCNNAPHRLRHFSRRRQHSTHVKWMFCQPFDYMKKKLICCYFLLNILISRSGEATWIKDLDMYPQTNQLMLTFVCLAWVMLFDIKFKCNWCNCLAHFSLI